MKSLLLTLVLFAAPTFAFVAEAAEGDAWGGLEESMDETKVADSSSGDDESAPDLEPIADVKKADGEEDLLAKPATPDPTPSAKASKEDLLYNEYDAYIRRKEEGSEEDRMRQRLFHEGAKNNISFDVAIDDMAKFDRGKNSGFPDSTYGVSFGYHKVPWRSRYFGRLGLGLTVGAIGLSSSGTHFRIAFLHAGPRLTYELKFMTGQVLVPVAFLGYDRLFNQIEVPIRPGMDEPSPGASASLNTLVFGGGLLLNLNRLDSHTGTQALVSTGIRKFNLALNYVVRRGSGIGRSSNHVSAGLRFEY